MKITLFLLILAVTSSWLTALGDLPDARTSIFGLSDAPKLVAAVSYSPPVGVTGYWIPSKKDVPRADFRLEAFLHHSSPGSNWNWTRYGRQVAGIVVDGRKLIFISYFIYDPAVDAAEAKRRLEDANPDSWADKPYTVFDGGTNFFRVLFDPKKGDYVWCEFNGNA